MEKLQETQMENLLKSFIVEQKLMDAQVDMIDRKIDGLDKAIN